MRNQKTRDMVLCALFAALMVIGAQVSISLPNGVPFTLQILFALLAGGILGSKLGAISIILYTVMGFVGLPVFAEGANGAAILAKPTFGYIIGFIVAAYAVGFIVERSSQLAVGKKTVVYFVATLVGLALCYLIGVPYLYFFLKTTMGDAMTPALALTYGFTPFILLDAIKAGIVSVLLLAILPRLEQEGLIAIKK